VYRLRSHISYACLVKFGVFVRQCITILELSMELTPGICAPVIVENSVFYVSVLQKL
jgi:hypothetical protein